MTEKRFVYYEHKGADYILENPNTELDFIEMLGDCLEAKEIVDKLNELEDENNQLKEDRNELFIRERDARNDWRKLKYENEELKKEIKELESDVRYFETTYEIEERGLNCVPEMCTITSNTPSRRELFKYNKELEQRNKRQYNQLNKLWKLIETKDWETLTEMDNQMKKDEEQLQSEWRFINED